MSEWTRWIYGWQLLCNKKLYIHEYLESHMCCDENDVWSARLRYRLWKEQNWDFLNSLAYPHLTAPQSTLMFFAKTEKKQLKKISVEKYEFMWIESWGIIVRLRDLHSSLRLAQSFPSRSRLTVAALAHFSCKCMQAWFWFDDACAYILKIAATITALRAQFIAKRCLQAIDCYF